MAQLPGRAPAQPGARPLRILGVDPGLTRCGIGVVDMHANRTAELVDVGVVGTAAEQPLDQRLLTIALAIDEWLDKHSPDMLALERVFSHNNVSTVMGTAQASGVVIVAAARRGVPVALHTPTEVKAAVTGDGQAGKEAVTQMVVRILRLSSPPRPADAADALALCIAAGWRRSVGAAEGARVVGRARTELAPRPSGALTPAQKAWAEAAKRGSRKPGTFR
ncbi:crossover junction endodeoxyribonuclease RuvC [Falsarthrobacter nasiphocae]|uniref:Crossover junction endodeoxyribonuclease RuvC n=1 Tax=Falsarthrobacter nasiphocae TaxID=189863 RepID=A0AAE3YIN1_9MICC|nr:crossover junction endodeoxyribonuclease RuvC [Falsarthrobacter nasiphocae]MDR6892962.1 crossover junction endodeoxyribonuclease RuvC [Falsarthrobacter nasiphocae]